MSESDTKRYLCFEINPIGRIALVSNGQALERITWREGVDSLLQIIDKESYYINQINSKSSQRITWISQEDSIIEQAKREIHEYLQGNIHEFSVPTKLIGTDFQCKLWDSLRNIPYGQTISYEKLAQRFFSVNHIRAIGANIGRNVLPLIHPCHRVIGKKGDLRGFFGGLDIKDFLLKLERR